MIKIIPGDFHGDEEWLAAESQQCIWGAEALGDLYQDMKKQEEIDMIEDFKLLQDEIKPNDDRSIMEIMEEVKKLSDSIKRKHHD